MSVDNPQRRLAVDVVQRLQAAGFEALFAGGCVRDEIMGNPPTDYDVATSARPEQVRAILGRNRTLPIGQAFGVIAVRSPHGQAPIEVATFRQDGPYSDGRHPDAVEFSDAEHDAQRRDFTINGLFLDPLQGKIFDYVGGQADIQARVIRAIGQPAARFAEDHLRLLRAPRFAARLQFAIEPRTLTAIREHAGAIRIVAAERVGNEMRMMLGGAHAAEAFAWLIDTTLWGWIGPQTESPAEPLTHNCERTRELLDRLEGADFELGLAAVVWGMTEQRLAALQDLVARWKLSNLEVDRTAWILGHTAELARGAALPWPQLQRLLIRRWAKDGIALARALVGFESWTETDLSFSADRLTWPTELLDPPPLLNGHDLQALGVPAGPQFAQILREVRDRQLMGLIGTRDQALAAASHILSALPADSN